jgi:hypothetical protein
MIVITTCTHNKSTYLSGKITKSTVDSCMSVFDDGAFINDLKQATDAVLYASIYLHSLHRTCMFAAEFLRKLSNALTNWLIGETSYNLTLMWLPWPNELMEIYLRHNYTLAANFEVAQFWQVSTCTNIFACTRACILSQVTNYLSETCMNMRLAAGMWCMLWITWWCW